MKKIVIKYNMPSVVLYTSYPVLYISYDGEKNYEKLKQYNEYSCGNDKVIVNMIAEYFSGDKYKCTFGYDISGLDELNLMIINNDDINSIIVKDNNGSCKLNWEKQRFDYTIGKIQ